MNQVDEYIIDLQDAEIKAIVVQLRALILDTVPNVQERIKWKIPFYTYHRMLCYINPKKDRVDLGLCYGAALSNEQGILTGDLKMVRHVVIEKGGKIPKQAVMEIIMEAAMLNETLVKR